MIEETLQEIGLNKRESICYTALLELGSTTIGKIIEKTEIPSSKIYEILNKLIKKGLASYIIKGKIKHYQASNPQNLLNIVDEKRKKIQEAIPELLLKQKLSKKQSVEIYEGQKAIFTLFTNLIENSKQKEKYLIFSINEENKNEAANLFFKNLAIRRKEKKLDVKLLKNIKHYKKEKHTKLEIKYTKFNLPQGITLFQNNTIILSWTETPTAIKIESENFTKQLKEFFTQLWKEAKK